MAQDPLSPKDDGRVGMPKIDPGMNKIAPSSQDGGRGSKDDDKPVGKEKTQADKDKILARMRKRFDRCVSAESENRKAALDDLKFKAGEQWPADTAALRQADKRPMLTINKIPTFVHQITNEQRQNRPSINISPVGDKGDVEAAKIFRGWIRATERESAADIAYDTAFDGAVSNGFGYWRLLSEYERPDSFNQHLRLKRVRNPFTVYLDPDRQEPDGADARYGFVTEMMPREELKAIAPEADQMPWSQTGIGEDMKNWVTAEAVRVVEYYEIENEMRDVVALDNGHVGFEDELADQVKADIASGHIKVLKRRKAECPKQTWYKATAKDILEEKPWFGKYVPIFQVIGDEIDIQGKVRLSGVIRNAKDPQRMYNYWSTAETEMIALAPKAPFIMEEGQVEGHEQQWKQANTKSYPYLLYKGTNIGGKPAPAPQRQQFAGAPQGIVQAKQGAAQDMMATTGIRFDSTMNERMIDESGKAIRELRRSGDLGSFHYVDNMARTMRHCGVALLDLAPHYLDTTRMITILGEDDTEQQVKIDPHAPKPYQEIKDPQSGKTVKVFNPKLGQYSVTVTIGPSFASKRIEAAESMMSFAKALPNTASLIADLIAKNQDWPGADEMARRLAKAVPPQFMTPDQKDVPPQVQAVMQHMEEQVKQLTQQLQAASAQINDRSADRAVAQDKVNKDFEAKLLAILQKSEEAMDKAMSQKISHLIDIVGQMRATAPASVNAGAPGATGSQPPSTTG